MNKQQQQQQQEQQQRYPYPLIDVDCNLLHPDLMNRTLLVPTMVANTNAADGGIQEDNENPFWILDHPSTALSNIQGIFSPSSTVEEAEKMYDFLCQWEQQQQKEEEEEEDKQEVNHNHTAINVRMSVGVHPYHTMGGSSVSSLFENNNIRIRQLLQKDQQRYQQQQQQQQQQQYQKKWITCIGETGLDYSNGFPHRDEQIPWFRYQLELAKEYNLPLFLHERLAFDDTLRLIDEVFGEQLPKIIVHCFTGSKQECMEYVKRGYYLSVSGYICKSGDGPRQVQECLIDGIIPMDKLMIETDAPYMGFTSCRELFYKVESEMDHGGGVAFQQLNSKTKKRYLKGIYPNVPSSLPMVLECTVSFINEGRRQRGEDEISLHDAAKMFYDNAVDFFGFDS
eukprot:CAMPEP_0176486414 /NCGR_PEP_ID=MMETSP0200_2-20121128/5555_1 /TAXON_ID=947934 /ORGANISM="Chaetoceros sp., Strain GSL56" /LENGTH=395 /DNA_ID=CAMNT_0017883113 /DNA_START=418 /DNA_END=1605 /DNA_ORIENTATION=-